MMDFTVPPDVAALADLTRQVLEREAPARMHETLAEAGVLAAALPTPAGGEDLGVLGHCAVLIEIGRALAPVPYLDTVATGAAAIAGFGSPYQRDTWAVPAGRGKVTIAIAHDGFTATAAGLLSGTADAVAGAPDADLILTCASERVFAVPPGDGVSVTAQTLTDGTRAGRLELRDARAEVLTGATPRWLRAHATVGTCALQLGVLERALEMTASYAQSREAFGKPIGSFQAVTQRLADAWIDVEAVRLTMWQAAWRLAEGLPADDEVAIAKFWAAEAGHRVAHTAVHIHGGIGIDVTYPVHRYFTAAKRLEFTLGGATAQLLRLGGALADGAA
jgi:alkylation response protein AidB-like acyl-CoA dehydrogenase